MAQKLIGKISLQLTKPADSVQGKKDGIKIIALGLDFLEETMLKTQSGKTGGHAASTILDLAFILNQLIEKVNEATSGMLDEEKRQLKAIFNKAQQALPGHEEFVLLKNAREKITKKKKNSTKITKLEAIRNASKKKTAATTPKIWKPNPLQFLILPPTPSEIIDLTL